MKIGVTYSSKAGLLKTYKNRYHGNQKSLIPPDIFAEGDSQETIDAVIEALQCLLYDVEGVEADNNLPSHLKYFRPDLVFNIAEGLFGDFRESYVPMICEQLNIPYTGSDPLTLAICLNKVRTKEILGYNGIPSAPFQVFSPGDPFKVPDFQFPAIVKPVAEGSSKGVFNDSVVNDSRTAMIQISKKLNQYNQPVLLEKFLEGDEYTVAIWGNGDEIKVLPIIGISYKDLPEGAKPLYSYEAKWIWDTPQKPLDIFQCPAKISKLQKGRIQKLVLETYRVLGIRDWCRIDIRCDQDGNPYILEVNPLPGILPNPEDNSCFPKAARTAGYSYSEMLDKIIQISCQRLGIKNDIEEKIVVRAGCV